MLEEKLKTLANRRIIKKEKKIVRVRRHDEAVSSGEVRRLCGPPLLGNYWPTSTH
jgi:hypothetical protein